MLNLVLRKVTLISSVAPKTVPLIVFKKFASDSYDKVIIFVTLIYYYTLYF